MLGLLTSSPSLLRKGHRTGPCCHCGGGCHAGSSCIVILSMGWSHEASSWLQRQDLGPHPRRCRGECHTGSARIVSPHQGGGVPGCHVRPAHFVIFVLAEGLSRRPCCRHRCCTTWACIIVALLLLRG